MPDFPPLTPIVASLPETVPFVGPETQERRQGSPFRARLGANENGFGPSPAAVEAIQAAASDMWKYCDPENHELRHGIATELGIASENIVIGEGIDGLLGLVVRQYARPGDPVVTSLGGYPTFNFHVAGFGARLIAVPYQNDRANLSGLLEAAWRERARIVYLANPDNPMGSWWEADEITTFIAALPPATLLVLDEAYCELAPASARPPIDVFRPNLLRMRTFSKAYGLAGLRCGYAIGEAPVIRAFEKVRNHFGVTRMAQAACLAALRDRQYLERVVNKVAACRQRLGAIAEANGLKPLPSATNFVAMDCGTDGVFAEGLLRELGQRGIFIRKPMAPGLDRCIRVSVGPEAEIDLFEAELGPALAKVRGSSRF